jgi:hypothetical protein
MNAFSKMPKGLTALATAAALVAGASLAYAQSNDPVQPAPNTTGQPGSALGNQQAPAADTGTTMNNSTGTYGSGSTVDSGSTMNQSDSTTLEPRADRN